MTTSAYEKEAFFQSKLIEKYGSEYGITPELLDNIDQGTASSAELKTYTDSAEKLVMRFKSDMRKTEPDNYTDQDIEIIMAMVDANYRYFEQGQEKFGKIIPTATVSKTLAQKGTPPILTGFAALNRHSEDLSPQQIISQFGLDYDDTPYLTNDGTKEIRQPFVFAIDTPMNQDIQQNAKLPIDPRVLVRFVKIAEESDDPEKKAKAKDFLDNYLKTDKIYPLFRSESDLESLKDYVEQLKTNNSDYYQDCDRISQFLQNRVTQNKTIFKDAPYTGNTAPQYGQKLESQSAYADMMQEMYMSKPPKVSPGAVMSVKFPRIGEGINPERADLPAGSDTVEVARWDGDQWVMLVKPEELQRKFNRAMKPYRSKMSQKWTQDFGGFLKALPLKPPESLKKHIRKNERKINGHLQSQARRKKLKAKRGNYSGSKQTSSRNN